MVDQLRSFAAEVTRVAREVGTEGMLGGQAEVEGVSGTWKGLTENVNLMASNLTTQVRSIATGHDRGRQRRPQPEDHGRREGRGRGARRDDQPDGRSAAIVRRRGHARRARGRHRGHPRRPGGRARRRRHVEGPHRQRQLHGPQPDRPGPEHRPGRDRRRQRRPDADDHRRRPRGDPRAQADPEPDGRPALELRRRGHARRARGRHRGQARRPGRGRGRVREPGGG